MGCGAPATTGVPPACATVDAACLGPLPSGWQPIAVTDAGCDPGFAAATLVMNPRVADGGCACGACQVIGTFACEAGVPVSGGNTCTDPTLVTAVPGACTPAQAQHVEAYPPTRREHRLLRRQRRGHGRHRRPAHGLHPRLHGRLLRIPVALHRRRRRPPLSDGLHAPRDGGDECRSRLRAVLLRGRRSRQVRRDVTVYDNGTCSDSGTWTRYPVGTCNQFSEHDYESLRVDLVPPPGSCSPSSVTPDPGDASLVQARTICCQ